MEKEKLIEEILEKEWSYFSKLNNIGGRADCQDNREDFIIMRKSQWETFNEETLLSYLEDLNSKNNPLFQKYGQMMKYNSPQEYEKVKNIELRNLLKYICDGIPTDSLTEEIDMSIAKIKENLAYIEEYKSFSARMQDEREEGRKEGRKET